MPVIKSAKKKLSQDKKRTIRNAKQETALKDAIKEAKKNPTAKTVQEATSLTDKAAKKFIIHKNKAARIKSGLSKLLSGKSATKSESKTTSAKPASKKAKPTKKSPAKKK